MNCLLIEDEAAAARGLIRSLKAALPGGKVLTTLGTVRESVDWFRNNPMPDLVFMDIHLKDGSSFDLLEQVEISAPIIFCTAYDEYALKAFKANSISYLLKPVSHEDLSAALSKLQSIRDQGIGNDPKGVAALINYLDEQEKGRKRFLTKSGQKFAHIEMTDIAYFFKEHGGVYARTFDHKKHLIEASLDELESEVPSGQFFRINRQFLVSVKSITGFESDYGSYPITLEPPAGEVSISRYRIHDFKTWLDR